MFENIIIVCLAAFVGVAAFAICFVLSKTAEAQEAGEALLTIKKHDENLLNNYAAELTHDFYNRIDNIHKDVEPAHRMTLYEAREAYDEALKARREAYEKKKY